MMELCDLGSLHDLKEAKTDDFTEKQLIAIMAFSTMGLAHLHSQMSIHRGRVNRLHDLYLDSTLYIN